MLFFFPFSLLFFHHLNLLSLLSPWLLWANAGLYFACKEYSVLKRLLFYLRRNLDLEALWEGPDCSFIALTWDFCACDLLWDGVEGAELWKAWALCSVGGREVPSIVDGLLATPQDPHRSVTLGAPPAPGPDTWLNSESPVVNHCE